ncbi:hypothetical protein LTR53_004151 [Teratosphaeriaceae sp. CCFEE 6253]|nr:hypothetical protein LTR53_004151 [Teratosphaeriaceae sp. CCFEE 6253]
MRALQRHERALAGGHTINMDPARPWPPQLPRLQFGRTTSAKDCLNFSLQRKHQSTRSQAAEPLWPLERNWRLVGRDRGSTPMAPPIWSQYCSSHASPALGNLNTTTTDWLLGLSAYPRSLSDLSVPEQLAWIGLAEPARAHQRLHRMDKWVSFLDDGQEADEKDAGKEREHEESRQPEDHYSSIGTQDQLSLLQARSPLPAIVGCSGWTRLRYWHMTFYRRVMAIVMLSNVAVLTALLAISTRMGSPLSYHHAATATGANLLVTVLMRQEHVINLLFHLACALPQRTPLRLRKLAAKLAYNNGGVHAGSAISALECYVCYLVLVRRQFRGTDVEKMALTATALALLVLLVAMIAMSHPSFRRHFHDAWELSHRFGGWISVALVFSQTCILAVAEARTTQQRVSETLIHTPLFWFLLIIIGCLVYPWLRLKRLTVHATPLSDHAIQLSFTDRRLATCRGIRLAHNPLLENHGFATIPYGRDAKGVLEKGYSILISKAGNFTQAMIQRPPSRIWIRGAPVAGVMRLSSLFRPIVIVATGSGIGPCLSFLNRYRRHPKRVLWSARCPGKTFGAGIVDAVLRADGKALIIDTTVTGTPDLVGLAYAIVREIGAEGVMVISNPGVTRRVVFEMEARGIAAFGAVFDS